MRRRQPPPAATWILEHLTPADRDEAVAGDLLEVYRSGRTDAWYWRQVLWACSIAWTDALRVRLPLLVFVFLWSMLAPAWTLLFNRIENDSPAYHSILRLNWPLDEFAYFAAWILLNSTFLWAGMFVFILSHSGFGRSFRGRLVGRAFLLAPSVFLPAWIVAFILMNLYEYPGFDARHAPLTPFGEIVDLRLWAIVVRVPYFLSLLLALWTKVPRAAALSAVASRDFAIPPASQIDDPDTEEWPEAGGASLWTPRLVIAGCAAATAVASLLCLISINRLISAIGILPAAIFCIAEAVFAGATGALLFGARSEQRSWSLLLFVALACGPAWVWVPSVVLLANRDSAWALPAAAVAAAALAVTLRRAGALSPDFSAPDWPRNAENELFAETLRPIPWEWHGLAIAIGIYATFIFLGTGVLLFACASAAFAAFLFASRRSHISPLRARLFKASSRSVRRLAAAALPALVVTVLALLVAGGRFGGASASSANSIDRGATEKSVAHQTDPHPAGSAGLGFDGYQSIVLWPIPPKKEIVPPVLTPDLALPARAHRPVLIRFNGSYWYFQSPATRPGPHSHVAHGSPLNVNIHSTNSQPLMMQADQLLAEPVRISQCREIQVEVANRDNWPGPISIGMRLTDSSSTGQPSFYLGRQPVRSTLPGRFTKKQSAVEETIRFPMPAHPLIHRFDEITLIFYPDASRVEIGSRLAVEELQLIPR